MTVTRRELSPRSRGSAAAKAVLGLALPTPILRIDSATQEVPPRVAPIIAYRIKGDTVSSPT